jgi:hypothetical protein
MSPFIINNLAFFLFLVPKQNVCDPDMFFSTKEKWFYIISFSLSDEANLLNLEIFFNRLWNRVHCQKTLKLSIISLKGHGNEADFLGFLHKSVRHRSLTLHFEPFRFWLRICRDIHNQNTTPRLAESGSRQECI